MELNNFEFTFLFLLFSTLLVCRWIVINIKEALILAKEIKELDLKIKNN